MFNVSDIFFAALAEKGLPDTGPVFEKHNRLSPAIPEYRQFQIIRPGDGKCQIVIKKIFRRQTALKSDKSRRTAFRKFEYSPVQFKKEMLFRAELAADHRQQD